MELKIMGVEATLSSLKIIFECYLEHPVKPWSLQGDNQCSTGDSNLVSKKYASEIVAAV
jgi:hypothetical protein